MEITKEQIIVGLKFKERDFKTVYTITNITEKEKVYIKGGGVGSSEWYQDTVETFVKNFKTGVWKVINPPLITYNLWI